MSGRIAITLSSTGIDTISFISIDKQKSLRFFISIQEELETFEKRIKTLTQNHKVNNNDTEQ